MCSGITKNIIKHYEPILYELIFSISNYAYPPWVHIAFSPLHVSMFNFKNLSFKKNTIHIECITYMIKKTKKFATNILT